ncbi:MAG: fructosamine kinase family protein [Opitutales bacterium]|nr:fructosamine kinase family protein [Opitutales bacterium]
MSFYDAVEVTISDAIGIPFRILDRSPIGGGCINRAEKLAGSGKAFFLKANRASFLSQFDNEIASLRELANCKTVRTPKTIASGVVGETSYLVLEYIPIGRPENNGWKLLGEQLASLHQKFGTSFGWNRDNAIGATLQRNTPTNDWIAFYQEHRLAFQLELAAKKGFPLVEAQTLLNSIPRFFEDYNPKPSLLHGDLWSGNVSFDQDGRPFVYDPCCYYGDRETDLAFTEFFGGFNLDFYKAYNAAYPLDSGYEQRNTLYNLYHSLNHFNLFGPPYDRQSASMASELLAMSV